MITAITAMTVINVITVITVITAITLITAITVITVTNELIPALTGAALATATIKPTSLVEQDENDRSIVR